MTTRRAVVAGVVIMVSILGLWLGPLGGRHSVQQRAVQTYQGSYVTLAWPAVVFVSYMHGLQPAGGIAGVLHGHPVQVVSWTTWSSESVARRWARLHDGNPTHRLIRQLVLGEILLPLLILTYIAMKITINANFGRLQPGTGHGSARWGTRLELWAMRPRRRLGLMLGCVGRRRVALREREVFEHVLVVGPPGSGKSSGLIIPNLLRERGNRSLVIVDPKAELVSCTYAALSRNYEPWIVNFLDPRVSRAYNPLAHVTDYLSAEAFAECWITNTGRSTSEPFWDNAAKQLIIAAVLHLNATLARHGGATLTHLASFLTNLDLPRVTRAFKDSPVPEVRACAAGFLTSMAQNDKLAGSVFAELPPRFSILNDARVQATTSRNEVDFAALADQGHRPVALYLSVERTLAPLLKPLSACFFMQMFHALIKIADASRDGVLPRPVVGYLDEFGNLGQIPDMPRWMSTVRSARIGFVVAVQDMAQISALYGREGRQIIVTDCGTRVALSRTSAEDAEWFSKQTGQATVLTANAGDSRRRGKALSDRGNRGYSETGRPLLTAGEVTRLLHREMLVLAGNRQPLKVRQQRWYQDRATRRLGTLRLPNGQPVPPGGPARPEELAPPPPPLWDLAVATSRVNGAMASSEAASAAGTPQRGSETSGPALPVQAQPSEGSRRQAVEGGLGMPETPGAGMEAASAPAPATERQETSAQPAPVAAGEAREQGPLPARTSASHWLPGDL